MRGPESDTVFGGSIPELYERHLVPLIFEPYAADLARRVAAAQPRRVLEIAAGTGVVTRELAALPACRRHYRRNGSEPADDGPRRQGRNLSARGVAAGGCDAASLRR